MTKTEIATKILEIDGVAAIFKKTFDQAQELIKNIDDDVSSLMAQQLSWENTKVTLIQVYVDNYTKAELSFLLEMNQSETYQRILNKQPAIMDELARKVESQLISGSIMSMLSPPEEDQ